MNSAFRHAPGWMLFSVLLLLLPLSLPAQTPPPAAPAKPANAETFSVNFARGQWEAAKWISLRLPNQAVPRTFDQQDDCIANGPFAAEEIKQQLDNVVLVTDTGINPGEVTLTFSMGEEPGTAPGLLIGPEYRDGVLVSGTVIFVTFDRAVVWDYTADPATKKFKYTHLFQFSRWFAPGEKHVITCRFGNYIALRVDQSDTIVLRNRKVNSKVGIWGCHGSGRFYSLVIARSNTLAWTASKPPENK